MGENWRLQFTQSVFVHREILSDGEDNVIDWILSLPLGALSGMSMLLRQVTYRNKLVSYFENI